MFIQPTASGLVLSNNSISGDNTKLVETWSRIREKISQKEQPEKPPSSLRIILTSLGLSVARCCLASSSYCIKCGYAEVFEVHILASYLPAIKHQRQRSDSQPRTEFFMVGLLLRRRECEAGVELLNMCCSISETCCCQSGES